MVTRESLTGLLFVVITTGLSFARFSKSNAGISFSQQVVVHPCNSLNTIALCIANERLNANRQARLQACLAFDETRREGHRQQPFEA